MMYSPDIYKNLPQEEPEVQFPPAGDWLSDEPPMETELHVRQMLLLIQCLDWVWHNRTDYFACGNMTIYYSQRQRKSEDFRGPDFFVVLGTEQRTRNSWVVWEEGGQYPNVIVELLSKKTAKIDKGLKKQIYQDVFRTPEYFWFDPYGLEFAGFRIVAGIYEPITPNEQGHIWSQQLALYLGVYGNRLRFFSADGELILSPDEAAIREIQQANEARQQIEAVTQQAEQARQQAEAATQQAEQARQQAERLAAKLRELEIDPDSLL
ncbi:MAG: Uma2 family endonuclease [Leptolyngbyaceae cyanobacterium SM2_5_2]|nr:Uma2 family endonuclease [Leptolyngbyaceae cyanobacterium SM2_5_2]